MSGTCGTVAFSSSGLYGIGRFGAAEPHDRRIEEIERFALGDHGAHFRADAERLHRLVDAEQPRGLLHAVDDRLLVHRTNRAQIDHLDVDPFGRQRLGRLERLVHHDGGGNDRQVAPLAADLRLADRHDVMPFGHDALHLVEQLVLEDHHRIGIGDRRQQHALRVVRRGRLDHLQARHMAKPRLEALAVLRRRAGAGSGGKPHDHRHRDLAAEHEAHLRRLVDDLLHRERCEIGELELEDRPHAGHRRADGDAGTAELGDRRIHDALRAEALDEIARDLKGAAINADILAHQEDALIRLHGNRHGFLDRLGIAQFAGRRVHQAGSV